MLTRNNNNLATPYFQYFPEEVEKNIQRFNKFVDNGIDVFYAVKANNYATMIQRFVESGYGFDVASKEEIGFLMEQGARAERLCFSAPTKLVADLACASSLGIQYYAFDSEDEVEKILQHTADPLLFARIATQNEDADYDLSDIFGMSEEYFCSLLGKIKQEQWPLYGLTFHVGSQNRSISSWYAALDKMERLVRICKQYGIHIECINIGGGIPAQNHPQIKPAEYYIDRIVARLQRCKQRTGITKFIVEPGRALVANTMNLMAQVVNIKPYKNPPVLVLDVSVYLGLIEALEGFDLNVEVPDKDQRTGKKKIFKVTGLSCSGTDVIQPRCLLPADIQVGDKVVIPDAGAYTFICENFHMRKFPKVVNTEVAVQLQT